MSYKKFQNEKEMPTIEKIENFITNYLFALGVRSYEYRFIRQDKNKTLLKMSQQIPDEILRTVLDYAVSNLFPRMVIYPKNAFEVELRGY